MKLEHLDYFLRDKLTHADFARMLVIMEANGASIPRLAYTEHWGSCYAYVFVKIEEGPHARTRMMLHDGRSNMYFLGREVELPRADHGQSEGREAEYKQALIEIRKVHEKANYDMRKIIDSALNAP